MRCLLEYLLWGTGTGGGDGTPAREDAGMCKAPQEGEGLAGVD